MSGSGVYPKTAEGSAFAEGATWQRQKDSEEVYQEVYKSHIKSGGGESGALSKRDFEAAESFARGAAWQYEQDLGRFLHCKNAYSKLNDEVCQILGKALNYPWYKDDQKTFPEATEKDGVCVGAEVAEGLAEQASKRILKLEETLIDLLGVMDIPLEEVFSETGFLDISKVNEAVFGPINLSVNPAKEAPRPAGHNPVA